MTLLRRKPSGRRFVSSTAMFVILLLAIAGRSQSPRAANDTKDDSREVLDLLNRQAQAGIRRDVAILEEILAPEYFHTNPDGSIMTRDETLNSYRKSTQFSFSAENLDEFKMLVPAPGIAVASVRVTLKGKRGNDPFTSRYRVTYVVQKTNGRWRVVNSHGSLLAIVPGP